MNIEIANRLFELRKKSQMSQEELAEKIGVSRQAVSKWERAESSPDTDNLIELARLYEVSLDDLLFTDEPVGNKNTENTDNSETAQTERKTDYFSLGAGGLHIIDKDGSEVHIGKGGIQIKDNDKEHFDQSWGEIKHKILINFPVPLLILAAYLLMGFAWDLWHPGWIIFTAIPIYYETVTMISTKGLSTKLHLFPMALLCVPVYLLMGFCASLWHPGWVVFLLIPIYHSIVAMIPDKNESV